MVKAKKCYRVYFTYPENTLDVVSYIDETVAVSEAEAVNNVRWNRFGMLSIETLLVEKGIKIEAAIRGSDRDNDFRFRATGQKLKVKPVVMSQETPKSPPTQKVSVPRQMLLPGTVETNAQLL